MTRKTTQRDKPPLPSNENVRPIIYNSYKGGVKDMPDKGGNGMDGNGRKHDVCTQAEVIASMGSDIRDIKKVLFANSRVKVGIVLGVLIPLFSAAVFVFNIRTDVELSKAQISDIRDQLHSVNKAVNISKVKNTNLENMVKKQIDESDENYESIISAIRSMGDKLFVDGKKAKRKTKKSSD
jgi:hypothetical protein